MDIIDGKPASFRQQEVVEPCWLVDTDLGDKHCRSRDGCVGFTRNHVGHGHDRLVLDDADRRGL
jgi:hypothetical protein